MELIIPFCKQQVHEASVGQLESASVEVAAIFTVDRLLRVVMVFSEDCCTRAFVRWVANTECLSDT